MRVLVQMHQYWHGMSHHKPSHLNASAVSAMFMLHISMWLRTRA